MTNRTSKVNDDFEVTERQDQFLSVFLKTGSYAKAARVLGVTRQDVWATINRIGKPKNNNEKEPVYYKDTGCPDGTHPSCLNCPVNEEDCPFL